MVGDFLGSDVGAFLSRVTERNAVDFRVVRDLDRIWSVKDADFVCGRLREIAVTRH